MAGWDYKKLFKNQEGRLALIIKLRFIPDEPYLKLVYRIKTGKKLELVNPKGFTEKLQWLKLYDRHPEYTDCVDKYTARSVVRDKLGKDISFPLLGKWDSFEDIDFENLPNSFVLKCNHDSGSVKIINDKRNLSESYLATLNKFYTARLKQNAYFIGREYPYKNVKPCILAEELMLDQVQDSAGIKDYKFFCFDGKPEILFVATDRPVDTKFDFFDMDFNHLDIVNIHPQSGKRISKPETFDEMKQVAAKLSAGMKFVRIDLYELNGKVYFGEFTFFHGGGFWPMQPEEWELKLGDLIVLDKLAQTTA